MTSAWLCWTAEAGERRAAASRPTALAQPDRAGRGQLPHHVGVGELVELEQLLQPDQRQGVKPGASMVAMSQPHPFTNSASIAAGDVCQGALIDEFPPPCSTSAGSAPISRVQSRTPRSALRESSTAPDTLFQS